MKWVLFFLVAFVGIFTGLMFATGVAQKQVIPMARQRLAALTGAPQSARKAAPADSAAGAPASDSAQTAAAKPDTAAPAPSPTPAARAAAPSPDAAAQKQAVDRTLPPAAPRSAEQQQRDALIAKVYSEMKPEDAAKILTRLDEPTALAILSHFKAPAAARLLEAMGPERSVRMTQLWANASPSGGATP